MNPLDLFRHLRDLGVQLRPCPDGQYLAASAPPGVLTPETLAAMRQMKPVLLLLVETFEERAAWFEETCGVCRADAEWLAWQEIGSEPTPSY